MQEEFDSSEAHSMADSVVYTGRRHVYKAVHLLSLASYMLGALARRTDVFLVSDDSY